jgi:hypothetical protein
MDLKLSGIDIVVITACGGITNQNIIMLPKTGYRDEEVLKNDDKQVLKLNLIW